MIAVSACLCGFNCKYNGGNNLNKEIYKLYEEGKAVPICPESLGGLKTPRSPSEIIKDKEGKTKVIDKEGIDVTKNFCDGAEAALTIVMENGCKVAILKAKSPSCGYGRVYDGTFTGKLIEGSGITAELFLEKGIKVFSEYDKEVIDIIQKEQRE